MKYLGNYALWLDPKWAQLTLTLVGQARPRDWSAINSVENLEYQHAKAAGYDLNAVNWWVYEKQNMPFDIPRPPWINGDFHWWITKLMPGQFMPMHTDPHTHDRDCNRYWIPLQDYHPGHIFVLNDEIITKYKAGDVWTYDTSYDMHGAANIGHIPRVVLQVTEYL